MSPEAIEPGNGQDIMELDTNDQADSELQNEDEVLDAPESDTESEDETSEDVESDAMSAKNTPNIMFVGRDPVTITVKGESKTEMRKRTPPTHIQNGMEKINLPSRKVQEQPFYHEKADTIIQLFPTLYKHFK